MYLRYPLPEEIKKAILQHGEDAYGAVIKYLVENFGLARNKAQKPAQEIIEKVLAEREQEQKDKEIQSQEQSVTKLDIKKILDFVKKKNRSISEKLLESIIRMYTELKKQNPQEDQDTLSMLIYRKSLFTPEIRESIPESMELRKIINQLINDIELAYSVELQDIQLEYQPLQLNMEDLIVFNALASNRDFSLKDALMHDIGENVALFPSLALALDTFLYNALEKKDRITKFYNEIQSKAKNFSFGLLPEPFLPMLQKTEDVIVPNDKIVKALEKKFKDLIINTDSANSITVSRKSLLALGLAAILAEKLEKIASKNDSKLSDRMSKKIDSIVHEDFTEIFNFSDELSHGNWPPQFRSFGERASKIRELFGITSKKDIIIAGERTNKTLADREIALELERVAQFNKDWRYMLGLISVSAESDNRLYNFLCSVFYGLVPDNFSQQWETRRYFGIENIGELLEELISYKNLNRYYMIEREAVKQILEDKSEIFHVRIANEDLYIKKEELQSILRNLKDENQFHSEDLDLILFTVANSAKYGSPSDPENIITSSVYKIKELFYSTEDFLVKTKRGIGAIRNGIFHYISALEFYDFLFRLVLGEQFRDKLIEIQYSELQQILPNPVVIIVDNIVSSIPSLNEKFGDLFEISFFFIVGEYIELTHPNVISKINVREFIDAVRNYSIYPGIGFIKISVVGKPNDYIFMPINILQLSYGLEAFITETSTIGRIALEYGLKDKWAPKLDRKKFIINKITAPPILELLKEEIKGKKAPNVESESYRIQLGRFAKDFHEFMKKEHRIDINSSLSVGFPEYPLTIALNKNNKQEETCLEICSLKDFSEIIKLAFERDSNTDKEELITQINKKLEELYIVSSIYPIQELSSPLKEFLMSLESGSYSIEELLNKIPQDEHYSLLRTNLTNLKDITNDIIFYIKETNITIETKYDINDAIKRLTENVIISGEAVDGSWQLSRDMKLLFYQSLSQKIESLLNREIGNKKVYEIIVPK